MRTPIFLVLATLTAACAETPAQQADNDAIPSSDTIPAKVAIRANDEIEYECPEGTKLVELRDRLYCVDPNILQEEIERAWDHREDW